MNGLELRYFILKPSGKGQSGKASRAALRRYADLIQDENPILAQELHEWANREQIKAVEAGEIP